MKWLALFILPTVFFVGCFGGGSNELAEAEKELEELSAKVRELEKERTALRKERAAKKSKVPRASKTSKVSKTKKTSESATSDRSKEVSEAREEAEKYLALLEEQVAMAEDHISKWQGPMWKSFEGLPFNGLELESGEVIPEVTIEKVSDANLTVSVNGSSRIIPWEDLSKKTRLTFVHGETVIGDIVQ